MAKVDTFYNQDHPDVIRRKIENTRTELKALESEMLEIPPKIREMESRRGKEIPELREAVQKAEAALQECEYLRLKRAVADAKEALSLRSDELQTWKLADKLESLRRRHAALTAAASREADLLQDKLRAERSVIG